jgi:hypothetical protein
VPTGLRIDGFARIVVDALNVRTAPSIDAPQLVDPGIDGPSSPVRLGSESHVDEVYILEGPVMANGYRWWRIGPTEYVWDIDEESGAPMMLPAPIVDELLHIGWVAEGDDDDAWIVPVDPPCPAAPVETADVTLKAASWAVRLACFRGQVLTLRGWMAIAAGATEMTLAVFPHRRTWEDPDNHDRLPFRLDPANLVVPVENQWLGLTGQFDHPSALTCDPVAILECRSTFTVTSVAALGP